MTTVLAVLGCGATPRLNRPASGFTAARLRRLGHRNREWTGAFHGKDGWRALAVAHLMSRISWLIMAVSAVRSGEHQANTALRVMPMVGGR